MRTGADGIEVVSGNPDESELAAVLCVLLAAMNGRSQPGEIPGQAVPLVQGAGKEPLMQHLVWRVVPAAPRLSTSVVPVSGTAVRRRRRRLKTAGTRPIYR